MRIIAFVLSLIPFFIFAQTEISRSITVLGEARKYIEPDEVELMILFSESENQKKDNELQLKELALKKLATSYGIPERNISIELFAAAKFDDYYSVSKNAILTKAYKLTIHDVGIVDEIVFNLFQIGAINVSVWDLRSEDIIQANSEAAIAAFLNAKEKAKLLAKQAGFELGDAVTIEEYKVPVDPYRYSFDNLRNSDHYPTHDDGFGNDGIGVKEILVDYKIKVSFEMK